MKREMWEMPDNEINELLNRAIWELDGLYLRLGPREDLVVLLRHKRDACKRKSELWHKYDAQLFGAMRDLGVIEQRIAAQETIVQAFRNEMTRRNPPFWTRHDLDRINRQRGGM